MLFAGLGAAAQETMVRLSLLGQRYSRKDRKRQLWGKDLCTSRPEDIELGRGRRHQSHIRHPAAHKSTIDTLVKSSNFFIFRFSHRNGIVTGEWIAKKLYTTLNDVQTQHASF